MANDPFEMGNPGRMFNGQLSGKSGMQVRRDFTSGIEGPITKVPKKIFFGVVTGPGKVYHGGRIGGDDHADRSGQSQPEGQIVF